MNAVELFAGAGGAALGLHRAGIRALELVEWDAAAAATLAATGLGPVYHGDVRDWTATEAPAFRGRVDLLWASPPCQGFSTGGKREGALDERNGWPWTMDAIDAVRPTWFLAENVAGMTKHTEKAHDGRPIPKHLEHRLPTSGLLEAKDELGLSWDEVTVAAQCAACYLEIVLLPMFRRRFAHVSARELDAADYGTPQRRRRMFIAAGPRPFAWPKPTHSQEQLVYEKWINGRYWVEHGIEPTAPTREEERLLRRGVTGNRGPLRWATIRDVLGPVWMRHQSDSAGTIQRNPDEAAPTVSTKGTLYEEVPASRHRMNPTHVGEQLNGNPKHPDVPVDRPMNTLRAGGSGHGAPHYWAKVVGGGSNPRLPGRPQDRTYRDLTDTPSTTIAAQHGGGAGNAGPFVLRRNPAVGPGSRPELLDSPSVTVTTTEVKGTRGANMYAPLKGGGVSGGPDRASDVAWLATGKRRLTPEECALLQGFPLDWPWHGNKTEVYRQIGNAVAPEVAEALGRALRKS